MAGNSSRSRPEDFSFLVPGAQHSPPAYPGSLLRLKCTYAIFALAGFTRSEIKHVSQRQAQTHRGHENSWSHRWPQTRCCLQQPPHSGLTLDTGTDSHVPSSSWACRGRRSPVRHTHHTHHTCSQAQAHSRILQAPACPLCTPSSPSLDLSSPYPPLGPRLDIWSSWGLAVTMHHLHTCCMGTSLS